MTSECLLASRRLQTSLLCVATWLILLASQRTAILAEDDALARQQNRIQNMSPAEKRELWELQQRFYRLAPEKREQLRDLHASIAADPNAERLRQVMAGYADWLKTLPAGERAELLSLPAEQRIARIRASMQQQATSHMRFLMDGESSDRDLAAITRWMKEIVKRREAEILKKMPMLHRDMVGARDPDHRMEKLIQGLQYFGWRPDLLRPTDEDIERLKDQLSPSALERLNKAQEEGKLVELAGSWMRAAMVGRRPGPPVDRAELERFYREELDPEEREYLESLPPERMQYRLMLMYNAHRFGPDFGPGRPGSGRLGPGRLGPDRPGPDRPGLGRPRQGPRGMGGMGGGFREPGSRPWPPDRNSEFDDPRRKPQVAPPGEETDPQRPEPTR